ncbi:MAG: efflux RND transporter periplasmic adaptor subunit, partial [Planctomycetota bacterium]
MNAMQRFLYALRIASVRLRFIGLLVAVILVTAYWDSTVARVERLFRPAARRAAAGERGVEHFCPMHPRIVQPEPGKCPICGMPLSKRTKGAETGLPEGVLARVQLSPFRVAQAGIRTSVVDWRPLEREVTTVGFVEYDERRLAKITARFPGRVESLAVDFTGVTVEKGKPLAVFYSPEMYAAQESLFAALRGNAAGDGARSLVDAARSRLLLWGLSPEQVEAIEREGIARPTVAILAPLSGIVTRKAVVVGDYGMEGSPLFEVADLSTVWLKARVYEDDLGLVSGGRRVSATTSAYPGETFEGTVAFVDPFLDRRTRTADVRADLPNL